MFCLSSPDKSIEAFLGSYDRIAVCGGFMTGKTAVTDHIHDRFVYHTDKMPHSRILACCQSAPRWVIVGDTAHEIAEAAGAQAIVHCTRGRVEPRGHPDKPPRRYDPYHLKRKREIDAAIEAIPLPRYESQL